MMKINALPDYLVDELKKQYGEEIVEKKLKDLDKDVISMNEEPELERKIYKNVFTNRPVHNKKPEKKEIKMDTQLKTDTEVKIDKKPVVERIIKQEEIRKDIKKPEKEIQKIVEKPEKNIQKNIEKKGSKWLSFLFIALSIGLTLISLNAGYYIYDTLFGMSFALLISGVLETLRLSSLYSFKAFKKGGVLALGIVLYIMVAGTCFLASVTSFSLKVEEQAVQYGLALKEKSFEIKKAIAKYYEDKINEIKKHQDLMQQRLAKYPNSKYYKTRIEQDNEKIAKLLEEKDKILSQEITEDWLINKGAEFGVKIDLETNKKYTAVYKTVKTLYNMDYTAFQKTIGVILAILTEIGIILLALMSFKARREE